MHITRFAAVAALLTVFVTGIYSAAVAQTTAPKPTTVTTADIPGDGKDNRRADGEGGERRTDTVCVTRC